MPFIYLRSLQTVAASLAQHVPWSECNVFIHHSSAQSGQVLNADGIAHWPQAGDNGNDSSWHRSPELQSSALCPEHRARTRSGGLALV